MTSVNDVRTCAHEKVGVRVGATMLSRDSHELGNLDQQLGWSLRRLMSTLLCSLSRALLTDAPQGLRLRLEMAP